MIKKVKNYLLMAVAALTLAVPVAAPVAVYAADCSTNTANKIASGASSAVTGNTDANAIDCGDSSTATDGIRTLAGQIVNIFSIIVGIVSVIMIIYGGFRYVTSGGESSSVGNAKNTLIYAIIGLIIVALAQVIVHFVLSASSNVTT
jgi:hypothetical protein